MQRDHSHTETMSKTNLFGPYPLTDGSINDRVAGKGPGVFALGKSQGINGFQVLFVGRSDDDLNLALHDQAGKFPEFQYAFHATPRHAFIKECLLSHEIEPHDNAHHPQPPPGEAQACPICGK